MKSSRKIEVSKASLVSLKAELSRKQDEVNKARIQGAYIHPIPRPKKQTVWTKKNARVTERNEKDLEQQKEEEDILKKSRSVLEAKTKLYETLSHKPSTADDTFLVNFQQKKSEEQEDISDEYNSPSDSEEHWMDYVDCLGRTRKCLKEDLAYVKEKDSVLSKSLGNTERNLEDEKDDVEDEDDNMEPELLSANLKREMMRQKWEQQEELLRHKTDVHYQDVLFDEARSHGVGYFSFSQDETVRKAQQESLGKLRQQTQKIQEATKNAQERRKQQMEARLKAARRRKRERMGLPPEEEEPEVKEEPKKEEESKQVEELKPEPKLGTTKVSKIRPWDIGKEGVKEPMSQEEWVKKKRIERSEEFAPPSSYQPDFIPVPGLQVKPKPPLFFFSKKPSVIQEGEDDYEIPLQSGTPSAHMPLSSIGMQDHAETHNEDIDIDYHRQQSISKIQIGEDVRGRGAEIPPPPSFEYYRQSFKTTRNNMPNRNDLESAIDAGLTFLRQQSKEKQETPEKGLLGII